MQLIRKIGMILLGIFIIASSNLIFNDNADYQKANAERNQIYQGGKPIMSEGINISENPEYNPINAFDGDFSTHWFISSYLIKTNKTYIGYDFGEGNSKNVKGLIATYGVDNNSYWPAEFKIEASDDGNNWITLTHVNKSTISINSNTFFVDIPNQNSYRMYRIMPTQSTNSGWIAAEIIFTESPIKPSTGKPIISEDIDINIKDNFKMHNPLSAFDRNPNTEWSNSIYGQPPTPNKTYIGYDFGVGISKTVTGIVSTHGVNNHRYFPKRVMIQGSNDGLIWSDLIEVERESVYVSMKTVIINFPNQNSYRMYRILPTLIGGQYDSWLSQEIALIYKDNTSPLLNLLTPNNHVLSKKIA